MAQSGSRRFLSRLGLISKRMICWGSVAYVTTAYGVEPVLCQGWSMYPTVEDGDIYLAEHFSVRMGTLRKSDIIACRSPVAADLLLCKRLVAVEGDQVERDGLLWDERLTVPKGHVWLEGDNSRVSNDSRSFGPVPYGLVSCRLVFRIWPLHRLESMSTHWFWERSPDQDT